MKRNRWHDTRKIPRKGDSLSGGVLFGTRPKKNQKTLCRYTPFRFHSSDNAFFDWIDIYFISENKIILKTIAHEEICYGTAKLFRSLKTQ